MNTELVTVTLKLMVGNNQADTIRHRAPYKEVATTII